MTYKEALKLIGSPVTLWSWSGTYIGILESVDKLGRWRGNVRILAVTSIDPVNKIYGKDEIKNQGGTNIKPYHGEIPEYSDSLAKVKYELIADISTKIYSDGHATNILIPMFKRHFPNDPIPPIKENK